MLRGWKFAGLFVVLEVLLQVLCPKRGVFDRVHKMLCGTSFAKGGVGRIFLPPVLRQVAKDIIGAFCCTAEQGGCDSAVCLARADVQGR